MNVKVGSRDSEDAEVAGSLPEARSAGSRERGQPVARASLKERPTSPPLALGTWILVGVFRNPRHGG